MGAGEVLITNGPAGIANAVLRRDRRPAAPAAVYSGAGSGSWGSRLVGRDGLFVASWSIGSAQAERKCRPDEDRPGGNPRPLVGGVGERPPRDLLEPLGTPAPRPLGHPTHRAHRGSPRRRSGRGLLPFSSTSSRSATSSNRHVLREPPGGRDPQIPPREDEGLRLRRVTRDVETLDVPRAPTRVASGSTCSA